jgi:thiol-disulfide isomerase/thioredoxin
MFEISFEFHHTDNGHASVSSPQMGKDFSKGFKTFVFLWSCGEKTLSIYQTPIAFVRSFLRMTHQELTMKRFLFGLIAFILVGCAPGQGDVQSVDASMPKPASLPDLGPAPEFTNEAWLNVDAPLRLADLRGKVVMVEMWTFGCINCQNVMPALKDWYAGTKTRVSHRQSLSRVLL